jgi:hypothetical protein
MPDHDAVLTAVCHYDPNSPDDPMPPVKTYKLQLKAIPQNAASFNWSATNQLEAGYQAWIKAYNNNGYQFQYWLDEKGDTVSKNDGFYYTMPERDATLTAIYNYDPESPSNPEQKLGLYKLNLKSIPAAGGYFNWNNGTKVEEGRNVGIYAYANEGYRFRELRMEDQVVSDYYSFIMPTHDVNFTAIFDYDPSNPSNPGKNYWNAQTGEVIVDDFEPGDLYYAISNLVNGDNSKVKMITVAGKVNSNDWSVSRSYSSCTMLDMSRTDGLDYVPDWAFEYSEALVNVSLPASISRIGSYAFYNCTSLQSIRCHAVTPPTLGYDVFYGVSDGLVVYVPSEAVALYQDADVWKDFTILPLDEEVKTLEVNMPEGCDMSLYKDMFLELVNTRSGQKLRYVITDRTTYTFNSLIIHTTYNVYLKNKAGDVLGTIENVEINESNERRTFENLLVPRVLTMIVKTPAGDDVTSKTSITWTDQKGTFINRGAQLTNQLEGHTVGISISLSQELAMQYMLPEDQSYEVQAENTLTTVLEPIAKRTIYGLVKDMKTGYPLKGASVAVSQMIHGQYSKSYGTKVNNNGGWQLEVFDMPIEVTASATDYISKSVAIEDLSTLENDSVATFELKDINGTTIQLLFTYTSATGETKGYYDDYANVAYTVKNDQGEVITDLNVQYPQIVMLDEYQEGTVFTITATSKKDKFMPVTATATVGPNDNAQVTFDIKQLGGLQASFRQTDNNSVVGMLYDAEGRFVKKAEYNGVDLAFEELVDGEYTLVTMGSSQLFSTIGLLSQFGDAGLKEGVDYVKNNVTVKSGETAVVANQLIPYLDETKLYYTDSNTRFTVNKNQVSAGQYLTLRAQIDFKSIYKYNVSDLKLVFELPENCSFVDNSVMAGSSISSYTLANNRLTVPLDNQDDQVRFCVIPTLGGVYSPHANIEFVIDGKTMMQPIGSVVFTVTNLSITVPSVVAKTKVPVVGTAIGKSEVEIFDNGVSVGRATALANGYWSTEIELNNPYNLSTHSISATVVTQTGLVLQSDVRELLYDKNAIEPYKVTMINVAHPASSLDLCEYVTVFEYENPGKNLEPYWYWPNYPDFTFLIDFTNNDTTLVYNVELDVKLSDNTFTTLYPTFDKNKKCWVATAQFDSNALPTTVSVDYSTSMEKQFDKGQVEEAVAELEGYLADYQSQMTMINDAFQNIGEEPLSDADFEALKAAIGDDEITINLDSVMALVNNMSDEEFEAYLNAEYAAFQLKDAETNTDLELMQQWLEFGTDGEYTLENGTKFKLSNCDGLTADGLLAAGYQEMDCTDGSVVYVLIGEQTTEYVDFVRNVKVTIILPDSPAGARMFGSEGGSVAEKVANAIKAINDFIESINNWTLGMVDKIQVSEKNLLKGIEEIEFRLAKSDWYIKAAGQKGMTGQVWKWRIEKIVLQKNLLQAKAARFLAKKIFKFALKALPVIKYTSMAVSLISDIKELGTIYYSIPDPCPEDQSNATFYKNSCYALLTTVIVKATVDLVSSFSSDAEIVAGVVGSVASAGTSLAATAWGIAQKALVGLGSFAVDAGIDYAKGRIKKGIKELKCKKKNDKKPEPNWPLKPVDHVMDPSGYVYEAVSSNRLQGVTASCYYKETVEDMYGDLHENIVLWNAEEYAQENPLFTDENGMYQWDVPQGLWRVKFEKEGYQTTYSEWLPVPPPQLDVNIAMSQMLQPTVKSGKAYSEGVEIEFDKYMDPETMTTDNIILKQNGALVAGSIVLLNEEAVSEENPQTYASKVRFQMPEGKELLTTDEIVLTIRKQVTSYAGVQMQQDYQQSFDVLPRVRKMAIDSLVNVAYGGQRKLTIAALPVDASKGKVVNVKTLSGLIVTADAETLTLDANGQAELVVHGELPGQTVINFSVVDTDVKGQMTICVKDADNMITMAPRASRVSGTEVYRGTEIRLTSETTNADIYYTLDGTCPCETGSASVIKYDPSQPIVIASDNVTIKAMAKGLDLDESDVVEFNYMLKKTTLGYQFPTGWTWVSHNFEDPVAVKDFAPTADLVVSQTEEAINDPNLGLVGNLSALQPAQAYKVKVAADANNIINGYEYNALSKSIDIATGWNWIGYPIGQTMTLEEAFAFYTPMEGDYVLGQEGFAEYVNGNWTGGLEGLKPGKGYMFKSGKTDELFFNTTIVSVAASRVDKHVVLYDAPWSFDKNAYANLMPVTAQLYNNGSIASEEQFVVGAFAGTECRGIGLWRGDKVLLNIVGDRKEDITFLAADMIDGRIYDITESLQFKVDNVGTWNLPYALHIGNEATKVENLLKELAVTPQVFRDHLTVNVGGRHISKLMLTNMSGVVVLRADNLGKSAVVATGSLPEGVYVITVVADGQTYYKKLLKANK